MIREAFIDNFNGVLRGYKASILLVINTPLTFNFTEDLFFYTWNEDDPYISGLNFSWSKFQLFF